MRSANWAKVDAVHDGDIKSLPAGVYVIKIVDAIDNPEKEYVEVIYDIAEGEYKGFYDDDWGKKSPWAHHFYMSYKDSALKFLKGRLETIQDSNNGFDAFAAWDSGRPSLFTDCIVGAIIREEEYENKDTGEIKTRLALDGLYKVQDVRDGKVNPKPKKLLDGSDASEKKKSTTTTEKEKPNVGEIPF